MDTVSSEVTGRGAVRQREEGGEEDGYEEKGGVSSLLKDMAKLLLNHEDAHRGHDNFLRE